MTNLHPTMHRVFEQTGLTPSQLADAINESPQTITNWSKRGLSKKGFMLVATKFNLDMNWLLTGEGEAHLLQDAKEVEGWDNSTPIEDDEFEVPVYSNVTVSAGSKEGDVIEDTGKKIRMSKRSARKAGASITQSFSYKNDGDSMADRIADGARVTADASKKEVKDGKIYCFRHGVMRRTKYLYRQPDGGLLIKSHNPAYDDEIVKPEDMQNIEILGWVWEWSNMERW